MFAPGKGAPSGPRFNVATMSLRSPLYAMDPLWQLAGSRQHRRALIQAGTVTLLRDTLIPGWRDLSYTSLEQVCGVLMLIPVYADSSKLAHYSGYICVAFIYVAA